MDDGTARARRTSDPLSFKASKRRFRKNVTIPIFVLVPQVRLRKRLDLVQEAERVAAQVPGMVVDRWRPSNRELAHH